MNNLSHIYKLFDRTKERINNANNLLIKSSQIFSPAYYLLCKKLFTNCFSDFGEKY